MRGCTVVFVVELVRSVNSGSKGGSGVASVSRRWSSSRSGSVPISCGDVAPDIMTWATDGTTRAS